MIDTDGQAGDPLVPRVFHSIWIGDGVPQVLQDFAQTWRKHHPGWDYRLWRSPSELDLSNAHLVDRPEQWVPQRNVGQFVSDVMRYEILERYGGVYIDMDFECLASIDHLMDVECWAAWETQDHWVGNAILGAAPGALFLKRLIEALPASVEKNQGRRPNIGSGPQFLTNQYRAHTEELTVYDQKLLYPFRFDQLDRATDEFPDALARHHWANKSGIAR